MSYINNPKIAQLGGHDIHASFETYSSVMARLRNSSGHWEAEVDHPHCGSFDRMPKIPNREWQWYNRTAILLEMYCNEIIKFIEESKRLKSISRGTSTHWQFY